MSFFGCELVGGNKHVVIKIASNERVRITQAVCVAPPTEQFVLFCSADNSKRSFVTLYVVTED